MVIFRLKTNGYKSKKEIRPACKDLISENLLDSREELLEDSLEEYESENEIGAKFNRLLADEVKYFRHYPKISNLKIIKCHGLFGGVSSGIECKCGEKLTNIEAEVTMETEKKEKEKVNVKLFYFCYNCGFTGKIRKGFGL